MKNTILKLNNISKSYGKNQILKQINLEFEEGKIYGLVGENGVGKTTIIRIMAGLIQPTAGTVEFQQKINMSCIVESPSLQNNLSAIDNLIYQALACGIKVTPEEINQILQLIGLENVDRKKKVKDFSLGMKQRLAIGVAIIDVPQFLILDEPLNGLDPVGIKEMREIILRLRDKYHMTILVSSHILSELALITDQYIIMNKGTLSEVIDSDALNAKLRERLILDVNDVEKCIEILKQLDIEAIYINKRIEILNTTISVTEIIDYLRRNDIEINSIFPQKVSFEDYYLKTIGGNTHEK